MTAYSVILSQKEFSDRDSLTYPFEERGLQFGDGVYEVIRVYKGSYYLLQEHVDRLFRSAEAIKLSLPFTHKEITQLLGELLEKNNMKNDGKVYLQATRGSVKRDHHFPVNTEANFYAYVEDLPRNTEALKNGVKTITTRDVRWENCYIKSLNLLPNVLAKQEAKERGSFEAILHIDGLVTECSSSNIYLVKHNKIYTFPATKRILHGCVRMRVEEFAKILDIPFVEEAFTLEDIDTADELFLTSSTTEVMPIVEVNGRQVGDGTAGPITKQLHAAYEDDAKIAKEDRVTQLV